MLQFGRGCFGSFLCLSDVLLYKVGALRTLVKLRLEWGQPRRQNWKRKERGSEYCWHRSADGCPCWSYHSRTKGWINQCLDILPVAWMPLPLLCERALNKAASSSPLLFFLELELLTRSQISLWSSCHDNFLHWLGIALRCWWHPASHSRIFMYFTPIF